MNHNRNHAPCYVEKMTVFLSPDGSIILDVGNQRLSVTSDDLERIVHNHLTHHALLVEIVRDNHSLVIAEE